MLDDKKFVLDFGAGDGMEDLKEKLIDAIKRDKKIYPIKVSVECEYDQATFVLFMTDKDGQDYGIGEFSCSLMDFVSLVQEQGFKQDFSEYEKLSKQEKEQLEKEAKEDIKQNPFKDKVKEFEE